MPHIEIDRARIWYTIDGRDDAPALLLLHSLGTSHALWDEQLPPLIDKYRLIRYDVRGHGKSSAPPGDFTIAQLGRDALAVLDAAGAKTAVACGISLGGLTSIWLGQHSGGRVSKLVIANTAARHGTSEGWSQRMRTVRETGMVKEAEQALQRWFSADFLAEHPEVAARFRQIASSCPLESYVGACAALRDADLRRDLHRITARTLVVAGSKDLSATVADGAYLRDNIPEARLEVLDASHLSNVERPREFSELLADFLIS